MESSGAYIVKHIPMIYQYELSTFHNANESRDNPRHHNSMMVFYILS